MALFGKKKSGSEAASEGSAEAPSEGGGGQQPAAGGGTFDPVKARKFFEHAKTMHESANYEYASTLWLQGLRFEPDNTEAFMSFVDSASNFMASSGGKGATKQQLSHFQGKDPVSKYLASLLKWGVKPADWQAGVAAIEGAAELGLQEQAQFVGQRVLPLATADRKARKDVFVKLMRKLGEAGCFDLAVRAGDHASKLDPSDGKLEAEVKNMSAEATMSRGGYSASGQEGGFRSNIKDEQRQRELAEEESLAKSGEALDRVIENARTDLQARPDDRGAIEKLGRFLLERGRPEDEKEAYQLYMRAHERTGLYRYKQAAGDIKMRVARRKLLGLAQQAREDESLREKHQKAQGEVLALEIKEYEERVANYPTDLKLKHELGARYYEVGRYEDAIQQLQKSKDATGIGTRSKMFLARSFMGIGWYDEAIDTFRDAIAGYESKNDKIALDLRYGLMLALKSRAKDAGDASSVDEALRLAKEIALENIGYRDVRQQREEISELQKSLQNS